MVTRDQNLAKYGNPNGQQGGESPWPLYNTTAELNLALDVPLGIEDELQEQQCDFWDTVIEHEPVGYQASVKDAFTKLFH